MLSRPRAFAARTGACLAVLLALAAPAAAQCDRSAFRVVLDVGHSPEAPGATSARGIDEYAFNLRLAAAIEVRLRREGFAGTLSLLSRGGRESLVLRAARSDERGADLLISVHHDSVQRRYLERWIVEGVERLYSDRFRGWSLFVSGAGARPQESAAFARLLADRLIAAGLPFTRHHAEPIPGENRRLLDPRRGIYRFDALAVLKASAAPAVLLEAGIIVHRDEELRLWGPERQDRIAGAVAEAVAAYCAAGDGTR